MAYRDYENYYTPREGPMSWRSGDDHDPNSGTTRFFSRRALYYLEYSEGYSIPYNDKDENRKKGE
jgi:hypothetical protein